MDAYSKYQAAAQKLQEGDLAAALQLLQESLKEERHFKTYHLLYKVCTQLNRSDEAFGHISSAYSLNPKNDRVAVDYATEVIGRKKDTAAARTILMEVRARNATYGPALVLLDSLNESESISQRRSGKPQK